ncbi:MAG: hypothetical protein LBG88_03750 [Christensenellaceae bacterium]|nr:hypothetical protein [Christensenellaceae bacterium]
MLDFITGLVMDGFTPVFFALVKFLPTVIILLTIVAMFEHSGLILGFSCTTLAVGAIDAKSAQSKRTARLLTFIPCSAKLPVLIFIASMILGWSIFGVIFLYIGSLMLGVIFGGYRVLAVPRFRRIGLGKLVSILTKNIIQFLGRISVGLMLAVTTLYTLQYFDLLVPLMRIFEPIFTPVGLANASVIACLFFGLVAKEMIIGAILSFGATSLNLTIASAISFIVFVLLYTPCLPALTAMKSKLGFAFALKQALYNFSVAYVASLLVYNLAVVLSL